MPRVTEVATSYTDPVTGIERVQRTRWAVPTLAELRAKAERGELYRDDLVIEVFDADTGEVLDVIDPLSMAFDLGVGPLADLPWSCDVPTNPSEQKDGQP